MQLSLRIILLLLGLVASLLSNVFSLPEKNQLLYMIVTFILLGVPHGSLDIYVEAGLDNNKDNRNIFLRYVLQAVAYILIWYCAPSLALLLFILITAFHFGEIDWIGNSTNGAQKTIYFFLGLCWIIFLLSLHVNTALDVFNAITRDKISSSLFLFWSTILYPLSFMGMILAYGFLFYKKATYFSTPHLWGMAMLQQIILFVLAHFTPLWIFFAFYFGIWHSILSLDKIRAHLGLNKSVNSWIFLLKKALPFSVMAWIGILYFIFSTVKSTDTTGMLSLVFIGLAVLTVPHLQVFTKLSK